MVLINDAFLKEGLELNARYHPNKMTVSDWCYCDQNTSQNKNVSTKRRFRNKN